MSFPSMLWAPLLGLLPQAGAASYWQQDVRYTIVARLDEPSGVLAGTQRVAYHNRSPDTLRHISFHLYLNAFRPGSRWAERDSVEGRLRFNRLRDPDYAFNHVRNVRIAGRPAAAQYPFAPDSTIVRFSLPHSLFPGDSLVLEMDWDARPSTLPRRQGRRGRRFDFAQWYPRVVVYDRYGWQEHPLYPAGEFYGEFATFDVTLDLPEDQVVGATGVPVEGDPGWQQARATAAVPVTYQRDWYDGRAGERDRGCRAAEVAPGRKCVRFVAHDVHHFALSLNPDYVYEEGRYGDVVVRVLYLPEDRATWGGGIAARRTEEALRWLDELFGPYPWPQLTNVHRIEGGGTEFPMMVMDGSASLGLILHEVGHNYLMGILANNEWKEGFLDEGFTSFQTAWYGEQHVPGFDGYSGIERFILDLDLDAWSQPTSLVSEDYRDFATYNAMIYTRGALFYHELRYLVGDETMRRILREYYARWKLKHVTETAFREVAEEVSGMDLKGFFGQWLHGTALYDYALGSVARRRLDDGSWETTVEVRRLADGIMPVEVGEEASKEQGAIVYARTSGRPARERLTFRTPRRPGRLMVDPRGMTHDWNYTNNRERRLFDLTAEDWRFDAYVRRAVRRDARVRQLAPTAWYTEAGELTLGLRMRSNYLGRYDRATVWLTRGTTGAEPTTLDGAFRPFDVYLALENPTWLRRPRTRQAFEGWMLEGRTGARIRWEREHRRSWAAPRRRLAGWTVQTMVTRNREYLEPLLWEDGGTGELYRTFRWELPSGAADWTVDLSLGGGVAYALRASGLRLDRRYDAEPFGRLRGSAALRRALGGWTLGARAFGGAYLAESPPLQQRAIPLNGADPYETFGNPLVRSRGAVFVRPEFFYHSPGNGNLRGYDPQLGGRWLASLNLELERTVWRRSRGPLRQARVVLFADGALADSLAVPSATDRVTPLADAGVGMRLALRIGELAFPLRIEFPLYVGRPQLAHNRRHGTDKLEFRWLIGLQPTF